MSLVTGLFVARFDHAPWPVAPSRHPQSIQRCLLNGANDGFGFKLTEMYQRASAPFNDCSVYLATQSSFIYKRRATKSAVTIKVVGMYAIQKRDRPLEIHPPRRMRATLEEDDSDFTDDGYRYEDESQKAYYVDESRLEDSGKGNHKYELEEEASSDSEYDNLDSEGDGEGDDSSVIDSDGYNSEHTDKTASESDLGVAHPARSSELSSADLTKTATKAALAVPVASSIEKANDGTELLTNPAPSEAPVTPTKSTRAPLRAVSHLSPQRRQTPMLSPPASSMKTSAKSSFSGISGKASASVFSKEM